jgi:hypothetical protein
MVLLSKCLLRGRLFLTKSGFEQRNILSEVMLEVIFQDNVVSQSCQNGIGAF